MNGLDELIKLLRQFMPEEMIGVVATGTTVLVIIAILMLVLSMKNRDRTDETTEAATGKPLKPSKLLKERLKTREAARAAGFIIDDVERDIPVADNDNPGLTKKDYSARYYYPEHIDSPAEWSLLRRFGRKSPDVGTDGWQLDIMKPPLPEGMHTVIREIAASSRWAGRVLEIDVRRNSVFFCWDEIGGKEAVGVLKSYFDKIKAQGT